MGTSDELGEAAVATAMKLPVLPPGMTVQLSLPPGLVLLMFGQPDPALQLRWTFHNASRPPLGHVAMQRPALRTVTFRAVMLVIQRLLVGGDVEVEVVSL